jgi:hypothetical protein
MFTDSGADATLLPRSAAELLGLQTTGERYEMVAFDGAIYESEAVRAVVLILNKSFRDRFLLIDSGVGVLGRNVLNRLRILWDGPVLNWEELPSGHPTA